MLVRAACNKMKYVLVLCLTPQQQLRSYRDWAKAKSLIMQIEKPWIEHATPALQGEWFIHYKCDVTFRIQCMPKCDVGGKFEA